MHRLMNIQEYLESKRNYVDAKLGELLEEIKGPPVLQDAMKYSVMAGGKRLRPVLALAAAEMFDTPAGELWEVACALELVHTYSLIHDDLPSMDDDDFRRGKPTAHRVFGEASAILAGDALLTLAFELLGRYGLRHDPGKAIKIVLALSEAAGAAGMVGGQVMDLNAENRQVPVEELEEMNSLKTGAMISVSVTSGALAAGASRKEVGVLKRFSQPVGLAFQIVDDLLNLYGSAAEMGKGTGTDRIRHKSTYPLLYGEERARERCEILLKKALHELETFGRRGETLRLVSRKLIFRDR